MSWSTMNGVNRSRIGAVNRGMQGTQPPVVGMMGTTATGGPQAAPEYNPGARGGYAQPMAPGGQAAAMPRGPNDGVRMPMPQQPQQFQPPAQPQFDPNDPRNAALAGYMNRG